MYHKAVSKLRLLLSASEEAAMRSTSNEDEEEDFDGGGEREIYLGRRRMPFAGSADHLGSDFDLAEFTSCWRCPLKNLYEDLTNCVVLRHVPLQTP